MQSNTGRRSLSLARSLLVSHLWFEDEEVTGPFCATHQLAAVLGRDTGVLGYPLHPVAGAERHLGGDLVVGQTLLLSERQT